MRKHFFAALAYATALFASAAMAETVVTLMHVESEPGQISVWEEIAREFESRNAGVKIEYQFLEAQAYKRKLTTLLQSDAKPHLFYSWGGGVFHEQAEAGVLRDITEFMNGEWEDSLSAAGVGAFTSDNKVYGAPFKISQVGFWYNKELYSKAGVDANAIETWSDFLAAMEKLKASGVVPIALGAADQWPVHFYWTHLATRLGGKQQIVDANSGKNGGFAGPTFVEAGELFKQLVELEPFQNGFLSATYGNASGYFGDGKAATHLMGNWDYGAHRANSVSKEGVADENLGWFPFPQTPGGAGNPSDTLGGINGWLVSAGAPNEAVDFLRSFTNIDNQEKLAAGGYIIPVAKGAGTVIENEFMAQIARNIEDSEYHQIFFDQDLGADVGRAVNDASTAIAAGTMNPSEAAEFVQETWEANQ